ncbi:MAG: hypothetical protein ABIB79_00560 [archaeon]
MKRVILILCLVLIYLFFISAESLDVGVNLSPPETEVSLVKGEISEVNLSEENTFYVKFFEIHNDQAFLIVSSNPKLEEGNHLVLEVGEYQEIDTNEEGYDDLSVKLIYLDDKEVTVFFQEIMEVQLSPEEDNYSGLMGLWWFLGAAILLIVITEYVVLSKKANKYQPSLLR